MACETARAVQVQQRLDPAFDSGENGVLTGELARIAAGWI